MTQEEVLKKHIESRRSATDNELLAAASLINAKEAQELADANSLVAETNRDSAEQRIKSNAISAEMLAKTTQESAETLARTTRTSADLVAEKREISAELLARTTRDSADVLAKETERSADLLRKTNLISVKSMEGLTIAVISVGIVQIIIGIITLLVIVRAG